ncbi:hypothetical protein KQX54_004566 [Cotesia glomerata]|uniref:Uncharacterized protein n=1 Tax=Cotesia glomerata TaxID=32391 RepID=A0AAV7J2P1_COTGL|nr:hypothetical protein KQX54_004566 [Cotesia glomerata]
MCICSSERATMGKALCEDSVTRKTPKIKELSAKKDKTSFPFTPGTLAGISSRVPSALHRGATSQPMHADHHP